MVQINRLRLSGFKSFVDKTELDIANGLNGIVGPNGCGKSNLVEALRWVMGENRAKNMRGGEMEDVIFAGTAARPARSIAEVSVILDNTDGKAPAPFGNSAQIEVTRRIERDKGSQYLVNGKQVRARDVQMLFADALTGSHSPALVSQGRVAQIISAKPSERRQMLEESAGVASLYTRRHEAELRLKAADENLARLDLVLNEMGSRANSLRNQAKQALRYRELSDTIRRFEALLAWQDWNNTRDRLKKEENRFNETDGQVRDTLAKASELTRGVETAIERVEETRKTDTEARATLQLLRQTSEQVERETTHRRNEYTDIMRQLEQTQSDLDLTTEQHAALRERAEVIAADLEKIGSEDSGTPAEITALEAELTEAQTKVRDTENERLSLQDRIRRLISDRDNAHDALTRATSTEDKAKNQLASLEEQYAAVMAPQEDDQKLEVAQADWHTAKDKRAAGEETLKAAQAALDAAREDVNNARESLASVQQEISFREREIKNLNDLLARLSKGSENSLLLSLDIPADLAKAVAAAAGEAALRAEQSDWNGQGTAFSVSDWAAGITPLNTLINVPADLAVFASSIGLADADIAANATLQRGQVIVSREGALWRWDGLTVAAQQEDAQSRIMSINAQIRDSEKALADLKPTLAIAETAASEASAKRDTVAASLTEAQAAAKASTSAFYAAEELVSDLQKAVSDRNVRRTLLTEQRKAAEENVASATATRAEAEQRSNELNASDAEQTLKAALHEAEVALEATRTHRDDIAGKMEGLKAAVAQAKQLKDTLEAESRRTTDQITRGEAHANALRERITSLTARKDALKPQIIADERGTTQQDLLDRIDAAEELTRNTSDAFVEAEAAAKTLQSDLRKVEEEGSSAREKRAVIQATVAALQTEQTRIASEIEERFSTSPAALENTVIIDFPEGLPSPSKAKSERDFLNREREAMGPVNLRADVELTETETEHTRLEAEKNDLIEAIARLREGIGTLNIEARERLTRTFDSVNTHFQDLFKRLFNGGEAHLKLEGAEDPLECGLEIYAQPPGKTLQNLGLLSGGEQTLTALSMIFAMFLSNPAPVCVLDEVDAPLDDANVDRVCSLLEQMARNCATRFLIITHHRMTMARMDKLYGVTMAERGISQLVSVNMAMQGDFLEQHKVA